MNILLLIVNLTVLFVVWAGVKYFSNISGWDSFKVATVALLFAALIEIIIAHSLPVF